MSERFLTIETVRNVDETIEIAWSETFRRLRIADADCEVELEGGEVDALMEFLSKHVGNSPPQDTVK